MKRMLLYLGLLLTLGALWAAGNFNAGQSLDTLRVTDAEMERLCAERKAADGLLQELSFNGQALFYDGPGARWFYAWPEGSELTLDPGIRFQSKVKNTRLAFSSVAITPELIRDGRTIPFIAYTEDSFQQFQLVITMLPLLRIDSEDELRGQRFHEDHPMRLTLMDNRAGVVNRLTEADGLIHMRGNGTTVLPKVGYRLNLQLKKNGREDRRSLLGMRQDGDWILYTPYNDQDKVRNVFSMNLWTDSCGENNAFGIVNGLKYSWVELFLNGEYWGIYALTHPLDAQQLELRTDGSEYEFKMTDWNNPESPDLRLAYELKTKLTSRQEDAAFTELRTLFDAMEAGDCALLKERCDLKNAADVWLFTLLIQGTDHVKPDGSLYNYFLSFKQDENGISRLFFTPWDMDETWGNKMNLSLFDHTERGTLGPEDNSYEMLTNPAAVLMAAGDADMRNLVRERYWELRSGAWSDAAVDERLDAEVHALYDSGAMVRERLAWPEAAYTKEAEPLSEFRTYVHARLAAMDTLFQSF